MFIDGAITRQNGGVDSSFTLNRHVNVSSGVFYTEFTFKPKSAYTQLQFGCDSDGTAYKFLKNWDMAGYANYTQMIGWNKTMFFGTGGEMMAFIFTPLPPAVGGALTGNINGRGDYALSWTASSPPGSSYYILHQPPNSSLKNISLGQVFTYSGTLHSPGSHTFNVTSSGGLVSNTVTLNVTARPLFGEDGIFYGGEGKTAMAARASVSTSSLDFILALSFMVLGGIILWMTTQRPDMAGIGVAVGFVISASFGLVPLWAIVFVVVVSIGAFLFIRGRS